MKAKNTSKQNIARFDLLLEKDDQKMKKTMS